MLCYHYINVHELIKIYLLEVTLCGDVAGLSNAILLGVWQRK